ncbi:hypothetical protein B0H21DRAFT_466352 [Amylocystis lapponica]|nr:hypothetical protein B0H21DRAFT_466352 [Amylocystis lapponica]
MLNPHRRPPLSLDTGSFSSPRHTQSTMASRSQATIASPSTYQHATHLAQPSTWLPLGPGYPSMELPTYPPASGFPQGQYQWEPGAYYAPQCYPQHDQGFTNVNQSNPAVYGAPPAVDPSELFPHHTYTNPNPRPLSLSPHLLPSHATVQDRATTHVVHDGQRCLWHGCTAFLDDLSPGGITRHLRAKHFYQWAPKSREHCLWCAETGRVCHRPMDLASLGKHISTVHLQATSRRCSRCRRSLCRGDALARHMRDHCPRRDQSG